MADRIPYATNPWSATRRRLMLVQEHMEEGGAGTDEAMPHVPAHQFDPAPGIHDHYPHGYDRLANANAEPAEQAAAPPTREQQARINLLWETWGTGNTRDLPIEANWAQHYAFQRNQAIMNQERQEIGTTGTQWNRCHVCQVYVLQRHCTQCLRPTCIYHGVHFQLVGRQHIGYGMVCRVCVESSDGTILGDHLISPAGSFGDGGTFGF
eukprot:5325329-Amphidinium_carterae.2